MEQSVKKVIALVLAVILTFSVVTIIKNDGLTASAASTSSISIKKSPTLKAGTVKATSVKLSWTTTKNADSYKLYKSTNNKNWQGVVTTKATSYTVSKLTAGTKYYFKLVAVSGKTKSPYSNTVVVTPKPERVGSLKIKFSSNTQASVTWNKVSGATGYELFLSTSSDFKNDLKKVTVKGGDKTSYTMKGMKNGKTYYVKVRAITTAGKKTVVGTCSYPFQLITKTKTYYNYVNQTVYATANVNVRKGANTSYAKVGLLKKGKSITRTAIGSNGWSKVSYNGTTAYISSNYLTTKKPEVTTTQKQESTTKKPTTTKKEEEWTTRIFIDENGNKMSIDPNGVVSYVNNGIPEKVDPSICYICGRKDCIPSMNNYYCVICKKTISPFTCHPASHFNASH